MHNWGRSTFKLFMMSKIQNLNGTHNDFTLFARNYQLFMMSKIQNLNGTHNLCPSSVINQWLFMMSKIQNLNGTHNRAFFVHHRPRVVYDVKDTKFEWNSQPDAVAEQPIYSCL